MAVIEGGVSGLLAEVGAAAAKGLHVTSKPTDYGTLGHYRVSRRIPMIATQAANGHLFAFRWTDATRFAVLQKLRLELVQTAAHTAALNSERIEALIARAFTTFHTTNATALTLTGNEAKKRTSMGTTLMGNMAYSNGVAAGMTGHAATLDTQPILELPFVIVATVPASPLPTFRKDLDMETADGIHPCVFAQNEGLIVRGPTTVFGAAGTCDLIVDIAWCEVTAF